MSLAAGGSPVLVCCVCLYARTGPAGDAVTIIGGHAVCEDHLGLVAQTEPVDWDRLVIMARRAAEPPRPAQE